MIACLRGSSGALDAEFPEGLSLNGFLEFTGYRRQGHRFLEGPFFLIHEEDRGIGQILDHPLLFALSEVRDLLNSSLRISRI